MWDIFYPILIHFGISQAIAYLAIYILVSRNGGDTSVYAKYVAALTGITGLLAAVPLLCFGRRDRRRRETGGLLGKRKTSRLTPRECLEFLVIGAVLGIVGNIIMSVLASFIPFGSVYEDTMNSVTDGQKLWTLVLWIGVVAPFAEEVIFRWLIYLRLRDHFRVWVSLILSGVLFGIYHMNLLQGIYATCMGIMFALFLEWRGNLWVSVLLHIGANSWGLIVSELAEGAGARTAGILLVFHLAAIVITVRGIGKYWKEYKEAGKYRAV